MKKVFLSAASLVFIGVATTVIIFLVIYCGRFLTMSSIEKLTNYDDGYDLYSMTVKYDYNTKRVINSGFTDTQGYVDAVLNDGMPLIPVKMELPSFGCSAYRAFTTEGEAIMGRNYDFKLDTSCMLVRCNPKNGYSSIAFAALNNIGVQDATRGTAAQMACLMAPYSCLDGVNEKGVSIAVLTLDSEPTYQENGRKKITSSLAIRLVLDNAATTEEAVDIIGSYDMMCENGRDYHFFISDASGDSRVVEFDCESPVREMKVTPMPAITNFFALYSDKVLPHQHNGIYGCGKERYDNIMGILEPNKGILSNENAWAALQSAASAPNPDSVVSNTQWSIVYNNAKKTADITIRRHWGDVFSFSVDD